MPSRHRSSLVLPLLLWLVVSALCPPAASSAAPVTYYIDSVAGDDAHSGTSTTSAWKSFAHINWKSSLPPGTTIALARGSLWEQTLAISASGTAEQPISVVAYGAGAAPVIRPPSEKWTAVHLAGSYLVVDGLRVERAKQGVYLAAGADHSIVRNCEATGTGIGFWVQSSHNLITHNSAHDLRMIVNTNDGPPPGNDDDYGAVGYEAMAPDNEWSYNRGVNLTQPSYDYGQDGGMFEIYAPDNYFHHNYSEHTEGLFEVSINGDRTRIAYNVVVQPRIIGWIHPTVHDFRFEHNTVREDSTSGQLLGADKPQLATGGVIVRNNIISSRKRVIWSDHFTMTHAYNLYHPDEVLGFTRDATELLGDAQFVSSTDAHLRRDSPAIDAGVDLGYTSDADGRPVPSGRAPDLGAYEYAQPRLWLPLINRP